MTPARRVACALLTLEQLRIAIKANGDRYDGSLVPNLTSVQDVLLMPGDLLEPQLQGLTPFNPTPEMEAELERCWRGEV